MAGGIEEARTGEMGSRTNSTRWLNIGKKKKGSKIMISASGNRSLTTLFTEINKKHSRRRREEAGGCRLHFVWGDSGSLRGTQRG